MKQSLMQHPLRIPLQRAKIVIITKAPEYTLPRYIRGLSLLR
jgi:hypothetical protein